MVFAMRISKFDYENRERKVQNWHKVVFVLQIRHVRQALGGYVIGHACHCETNKGISTVTKGISHKSVRHARETGLSPLHHWI